LLDDKDTFALVLVNNLRCNPISKFHKLSRDDRDFLFHDVSASLNAWSAFHFCPLDDDTPTQKEALLPVDDSDSESSASDDDGGI
jgi:hypothetical protein